MVEGTRIQKLMDKFNNLTIKPESEKQMRLENCETRFRHLENKITEYIEFHQKRMNLMREQFSKIQKNTEEDNFTYNNNLEEKSRKLKDSFIQLENSLRNENAVGLKAKKILR